MTLYKHYYNITETLFTIMTGTNPIRILNAIKYKNGMRVPISHRNFNICHFP